MKRYFVVTLAFAAFSCGEVTEDAQIVSLTIDPSIITTSETGMTDEFFTVEMVVANFDDAIDPESVVVFRQEPTRTDAVGEVSIDGDNIAVRMIAKAWFSGVDAGEYNIGAEVESASQSIREFDLAVVTVEE